MRGLRKSFCLCVCLSICTKLAAVCEYINIIIFSPNISWCYVYHRTLFIIFSELYLAWLNISIYWTPEWVAIPIKCYYHTFCNACGCANKQSTESSRLLLQVHCTRHKITRVLWSNAPWHNSAPTCLQYTCTMWYFWWHDIVLFIRHTLSGGAG